MKHLAHVSEVEDIDRNAKDSIQHGGYLTIVSTGHYVTIPVGIFS